MIVVAAGRALVRLERHATIGRAIERSLRHEHDVGIVRIEKNPAEISVALDAHVLGDLLPGRAAIVGAIQAAFFALRDDGVDALSAGSDDDADAAQVCLGELWNLYWLQVSPPSVVL